MSTKKLLSASSANLVIPISGLIVSPFLSRELGPDGRGLYAALTLPIVVYGWVGTFGLQDALSNHVRNDRLSTRAAVKVSLVAAVPLGLVGIVLLSVLGLVVFADDTTSYSHFVTLAILAPLHVLANLLIGALTGDSDIRGVNVVKVVPAVVRTAIVVFACVAFDLSAYWAGLLFLASIGAGVVPGLRRLAKRPRASTAADGEVPARSLMAYSLACLPGVLAAISSARLDQIIGLPVIGARELGYYAVAVSVAEIPMVIATAARTVLMGRSNAAEMRDATRVARFAVLVSTVACGLLATVSVVAVPFVFGSAFAPAVLPTAILCAGTVLYTCMVILTAVLLANDRARSSSTALVAGSLVGIGLLFALAPLGAVGAAIASLGGYGVSVAVAAALLGKASGAGSLRMLTIPYRTDMSLFQRRTRTVMLPLLARLRPLLDRADIGTVGVGVLVVVAWLRVVVPGLIEIFGEGRREFNAREAATSAVSDRVGDVLSLGFIGLALLLVLDGLRRYRSAGDGSRLKGEFWLLALVVAPLVALTISAAVNGQSPGVVALALPLAFVAIWLQRPSVAVLGTFGVLGAVTAVGSILLGLFWPENALLSGEAAGDKSVLLGGLLAGPYPHSNVLGIVLVLSAPCVFALRMLLLRWGSLAMIVLALLWTGSRTAQLAFVAMMLTYAVYLVVRRYAAGTWLISAPVAVGVLGAVLLPLVTHDPDAFTRRGRIWQTLLNEWTEHPVFGLGPDFLSTDPQLSTELGGQFSHGHNILVQLLAAGGMVALFLFAVFLALAWRPSLVLAKASQPAALLFLVAFLCVSWYEASHLATTLVGAVSWMPLALIARFGIDPVRQAVVPSSSRPTAGSPDAAEPQKSSVSRR